jgi:UDP-galactopyranose mutase
MWKLKSSIIGRVKKHFLNRGGESENTKIFENFPLHTQKEIISYAKVNENGEIPILASYLKKNYLLLLTDERLYWLKDNNINSILLTELKDADMEFALFGKHKDKINRLKIYKTSNEIFFVEVENGKPLSGFMNVIMLIAGIDKLDS